MAERRCPPTDSVRRLHLTQVFRFGTNIADCASFVLRGWKGERRPLLGRGEVEGEVLLAPTPNTLFGAELPRGGSSLAYLARTNASVINFALAADEAGWRVSWVGGVKGYKL